VFAGGILAVWAVGNFGARWTLLGQQPVYVSGEPDQQLWARRWQVVWPRCDVVEAWARCGGIEGGLSNVHDAGWRSHGVKSCS
jgi:hypothetical protein